MSRLPDGAAPSGVGAAVAWAQLGIDFGADGGRGRRISHRQIELLAAVRRQGSISAAARSLGVSFRGAWLMLETMEDCLGCELLLRSVGGRGGGGAVVSARGDELLHLLARVETELQEGLARVREGD